MRNSRQVWFCRVAVCATALMAMLVFALAPVSARAVVSAGTGPLNDVDPDAGTVEIRDQTYDVKSNSVLLDSDGKRMSILELEEVQAPWVIFRTRPGIPRRALDTLQLIDEDADEVN